MATWPRRRSFLGFLDVVTYHSARCSANVQNPWIAHTRGWGQYWQMERELLRRLQIEQTVRKVLEEMEDIIKKVNSPCDSTREVM